MQSAQSSRPASGAEHQFSHLWDMQHHTYNGATPSHGLKVGIGTLAVASLYEHLLTQPLHKLDIERCCAAWPDFQSAELMIKRLLGEGELADKAIEETRAKHVSSSQLRTQLEKLRSIWEQFSGRLRQQLIPFSALKQMLSDAGAPTEPEQIGISRARLRESFLQAYYVRRRFTVLDLAVRIGLLESSLDSLFGPKGVWRLEQP